MQKNDLLRNGDSLLRVLHIEEHRCLVIDCIKLTMPFWVTVDSLQGWIPCADNGAQTPSNPETLPVTARKIMHERYTLIAPILPFVHETSMRTDMIARVADMNSISKQTIRKYLCAFLAAQTIVSLAPNLQKEERALNDDEKNFRWALNKYFYTQHRHRLTTTYTLMLKEKYTDSAGQLVSGYPAFHRFKYFYQKTKKQRTELISRNGLSNYLRNSRPLLGDGISTFAPHVGVGMLDATVCDVYLVDEAGQLVGRPVLTACVDAFSGMCCGYCLGWEGGVYSLRGLLLNVIADKQQWCQARGVFIEPEQWPNCGLPGVLLTDMGSEYTSDTFAQLSELGTKIINLPPFRPDLKGRVEKFFDLVQQCYKKHLKGYGVVEPDYKERGVRDYRLDACLTIQEFEKVVLHCIVYYNFRRVIENYPYTSSMLNAEVKPYATSIFAWGLTQPGANFIDVTPEQMIRILLPRAKARFTRNGLIVNNLRYRHDAYIERYLKGGEAVVAYNPDDVTQVWLLENGEFVSFFLIEQRFCGQSLNDVKQMRAAQETIIHQAAADNLQAQIDLAHHIEVIATKQAGNINISNIRQARKTARARTHIDYVKEASTHE